MVYRHTKREGDSSLPRLEMLFTEQEIRSTVERLAREIRVDYEGKNPLLLGVLKGAFVFAADLVRLLDMSLEVEFISLSSYGRGRKESSGKVVGYGLDFDEKYRNLPALCRPERVQWS